MKAYRVEKPEEFEKLYQWLDKEDFDDLSRKCGARIWKRKHVENMLQQKDYKKHEFSIFVLEDDTGEIQAVLIVEGRFPEKDKIPCKIATNASFFFKKGAGKKEHDLLLSYIFRWAYEHGFEKADVWALDVYADWQKQLCGEFCKTVAEGDVPNIGHVVRRIIDIKSWVESCR